MITSAAIRSRFAAIGAKIRARPFDAAIVAIAVVACAYVVVYPFMVVRYPPITDLPFHASATSIFRHYWDASWGFKQQFTLHPLQVPYISTYLLGAFLAFFLPIHWATKAAAILMLALLPAGLAVLFHGMKKSPLWGLLGLALVWSHLTHWGFLNFVGAIGLFAMAVGFTLLLLDRPTRGRAVGLALSLLAIFFTHIFRFPFAILAVVGTTALVYPATRRIRPVLLPMVPSFVVYGLWMLIRPASESSSQFHLQYDATRWKGMDRYLVDGFAGTAGVEEHALFQQLVWVMIAAAAVAAVLFVAEGRWKGQSGRERWWGAAVTLLPLGLAGGFLFGFLFLPMQIGLWWYVFPREVTPAAYIVLAAVPDLPTKWWLRLPLVLALAVANGRIGYHVAKQYYAFERATADFREITPGIPKNPKLLYLVFNHEGSTRSVTPFIHLPAWVQAEKGGALSFHFVGWGHNPIQYRENDPNVPPPVPERWEWRPEIFDVRRNGAFFDWFLVRRTSAAEPLFAADPSIHLVDHRGSWWLFHREARP